MNTDGSGGKLAARLRFATFSSDQGVQLPWVSWFGIALWLTLPSASQGQQYIGPEC